MAVTIHKSQGLTFDRLIVDAGRSFASGQVYVALSRCRTLEGIVLKSSISPAVIFCDKRINTFHDSTNANEQIESILHDEKYDYTIRKVLRYVDLRWIKTSLQEWYKATQRNRFADKEKAAALFSEVSKALNEMIAVYEKFEKIIIQKTLRFVRKENAWSDIEQKAAGAVNFFFSNTNDTVFSPLKNFYAEAKREKGLKEYNDLFKTFTDDMSDYLNTLKTLHLLEKPLFDKALDKPVSAKIDKVPTHLASI